MRWSSCARAARREANTRATMVELYDGLVADEPEPLAVARLRSRRRQLACRPIFVAGFYYKTFMWPKSFWEKVYEPIIRRAAGLGRAAMSPIPTVTRRPMPIATCW